MTWEFLSSNLPHATATLNATATGLLAAALIKIRRGRVRAHKNLMLTALGVVFQGATGGEGG